MDVHIAFYGAEISQCQNVHGLKNSCAEMSQCHNVPVPKCPCAERSSCQKVLVLKSLYAKTLTETECPCAGMSMEPKNANAKMFL